MIIRKAMYGCGLYFFIKLAYNSPILCKFAPERKWNLKVNLKAFIVCFVCIMHRNRNDMKGK